MLLRDAGAGRSGGGARSRWIAPLAALVCVATAALIFADVSRSLVVALTAAAAALVAVGALCVRYLTPTVAVSVFGMSLGCAALMSVFAVTSGFENELTLRLSQVNGHVLLTKYGLDFREYEEIADRWVDDERVRAASPFAYAMAALVPVADPDAGEDAEQISDRQPVVIVSKALDPARAGAMQGLLRVTSSGTLDALRPADVRHRPGIALGKQLARRLGVGVGDHVRMVIPAALGNPDEPPKPPRHAVFEVLDTLDAGVTDIDNNFALVHLTAGQALFFKKRRVTGIEFELDDPDDAEDVAEDIRQSLDKSLYRASTWRQHSASTVAGLRQIKGAVGLVLGLLELVAGSALVASLLLLVRRKRVEIASLVALGADARAIFWVFEGVGLVAGALGALTGVALGGFFCLLLALYRYPLSGDVYPIDHLPVLLGPWDVLLPAVAAVLICGLVSGPVALVAARLPVLEGLRR
ncbi:MAG: ABC transporter permease [Myxococcales bacterium]|nr:ABC transporter permease [Myxococcales bacterium]MCB9753970.1 ABC transporter permease [Myxococcales bacterium]